MISSLILDAESHLLILLNRIKACLMSYFLPRLESGWHADQAILAEEDRVVVIRFGHDWVSGSPRHPQD